MANSSDKTIFEERLLITAQFSVPYFFLYVCNRQNGYIQFLASSCPTRRRIQSIIYESLSVKYSHAEAEKNPWPRVYIPGICCVGNVAVVSELNPTLHSIAIQ